MQDFFEGSAVENFKEHVDWNAEPADFFDREDESTLDGTAIYIAHAQRSWLRNWTFALGHNGVRFFGFFVLSEMNCKVTIVTVHTWRQRQNEALSLLSMEPSFTDITIIVRTIPNLFTPYLPNFIGWQFWQLTTEWFTINYWQWFLLFSYLPTCQKIFTVLTDNWT